jgi:hypothetical protein
VNKVKITQVYAILNAKFVTNRVAQCLPIRVRFNLKIHESLFHPTDESRLQISQILLIPKSTGFKKYSSHINLLDGRIGLGLKLSAKTFQKQLFAHPVVFA